MPSIPTVGSRLLEGGRLRVLRELGRGSMGVVLEVFDERTGGHAAIKIMGAPEDPELRVRFLREAKTSQKLTSPHALRVFEVGELDDETKTPFMLTEVLEGMSLGDLLAKQKSFAPLAVVKWCREALHALAEAHALGLVHRDLKPDNLFVVAADNRVKVIDFGIVKDTMATQSLTKTGEGFGSPAYMSPEQIHGRKDLDGRADLWSLGVTMFELLTNGQIPFNQDSVSNVFWAVLNTPAPRVRDFRPDVPAKLDAIVARCLSRDPNERYASANDLDRALAEVEQSDKTDSIEPPPPPTERDSPPVSGAVTMVEAPRPIIVAGGRKKTTKPRGGPPSKRRRQKLTAVYVASLFAVLGVGGLALVGILALRHHHTNKRSSEEKPPPPVVVITAPPAPPEETSSDPPLVVTSAAPSTSPSSPPLPAVPRGQRADAGPPVVVQDSAVVAQITHASDTGELDFVEVRRVDRRGAPTGDIDSAAFVETVKACTRVIPSRCANASVDIVFHDASAPASQVSDSSCEPVAQCVTRKNSARRLECEWGKSDGGVWAASYCVRTYRIIIEGKRPSRRN